MPAENLPHDAAGKVKPGPGRPKGKPNKVTIDLRMMVLKALDKVGGAKYLEQQAVANPQAFMTLVGKCLPKEDRPIIGDLTVVIQKFE